MKFSININQKSIKDSGINIDIVDAAILDFMLSFAHSNSVVKIHHNGKMFYWFSHDLISDEMPLLELKKDSVYRRLKKLCELGLIASHPDSKKLGKPYYSIEQKSLDIFFSNTESKFANASDENPNNHRKIIRTPSDENPKDNNISYYSISDKEENQQKAETLDPVFEEEVYEEFQNQLNSLDQNQKEKSCAKKEKEIFEYYNTNRNQMQEAEVLLDQRKQSIRVRLKDYGEEKVKQVIDKASKSDFLNGLVEGRDFKAGFDWIFKPSNFVKILEGNYDNKPQKQDGNTKNRIRNR